MSVMTHIARWLLRRRRYRAVFIEHETGREVFADLCRRYHILGVATVAGDAQSSAFRDGQRSVMVEIARLIQMSEADVVRLARQNLQQQPDSDTEEHDD